MNKNSNIYQISYASILVIAVGAILALVYMALKDKQDMNIADDTRKQILSSIRVQAPEGVTIEDTFNKYITDELLVDIQGNITEKGKGVAFGVDMKNFVKEKDATNKKYPVFVAKANDGTVKYVFPMYGAGLWGPIWGYVSVNDDGKTIYGANFSHQGETPGLGARISEADFQNKFQGKTLYNDNEFKSIEIVKKGQKGTTGGECIDAISGATITSRGVSSMMQDCLTPYDAFLKKLQSETAK
ncbi:MAG: NADH:ubiquinone reductase (Na(+)-transporting) subunit C [Muribaculaceae bacterium]|nr:NADH:ubiquinone reductase (Na(+)-transporting) subunit C [Muribaculaceae bacterium]MBQ4138668.1 NADH:ubiquinone reductase (Na(+)-transporting) subunit C [Muribaculaceae bacterium]